MKQLFIIGALLALVGCGESSSTSQEAPTTEQVAQTPESTQPSAEVSNLNDDVREKVKQYFVGKDEPSVKDATWTAPYMFKVGVIDDGTPRDGFAKYVCETLRGDFAIKDKQLAVEVIDIQKLVSTNKWVTLGKANCQ